MKENNVGVKAAISGRNGNCCCTTSGPSISKTNTEEKWCARANKRENPASLRGKNDCSCRHNAKIETEIIQHDFRLYLETKKSKICATSTFELIMSKESSPKEARTNTQKSAPDISDDACDSAEN